MKVSSVCLVGAVIGLFSFSAGAEGSVPVEADFSGPDIPSGWSVNNGEYRSPAFNAAVDRIELSYNGISPEGTASIYASSNNVESLIASFTAASSAASFDFPETTAFRSFRIAAGGVLLLSSFKAYVSLSMLETPSTVSISNNVTGTSFDAYWGPVADATGYKVYVWTNKVVGASAGNVEWQETMPGATNAASNTRMGDAKFVACFEHDRWSRSEKAGYPTGEDGTIRIGTSSENGWIQTPQIELDAKEGMAVRFFAKANATNTKSMEIAVERVSGESASLAGTATLTTEMQEFLVPLAEWESGDCIRFNSIINGDRRVVIGAVAIVSGYSEGHEEPDYIVNGSDVGNVTEYSFTDLPSVPVLFAVEAYGKRSVVSAKTSAVTIDLANPDEVAQLNAVSISSLEGNLYSENFDSLSGITVDTKAKDWLNGVTLPYWQAYKNSDPVTTFKYNDGTSTSGGLYALATNDTLSVRALGVRTTQKDGYSFGVSFTNDTGKTMTLSLLSYSAEQWGFGNTTNQTLSVAVKVVDGLDWISSQTDGWTVLASTESTVYSDPKPTAPVAVPVSVEFDENGKIYIAPGQVLMLKWTPQTLKNGTVSMMGIDNVTVLFEEVKQGLTIHLANKSR